MEIAASETKKLLYLQGIAGPEHHSIWDDALCQPAIQNLWKPFDIYSIISFSQKSHVVPLIDIIMILRQLLDQKG